MAKPKDVIPKTFTRTDPRVTVRDISKEPKVGGTSPQTSPSSEISRLEAQGYTRNNNADGTVTLSAPKKSYDSAYYYRDKERVKASYSPRVVIFDSSGRKVSETTYEVYTTYATTGYVLRGARPKEEVVYDYEAGVSTTTEVPKPQIEGSLTIPQRGPERADVIAQQEAEAQRISSEPTPFLGYGTTAVTQVRAGKASGEGELLYQVVNGQASRSVPVSKALAEKIEQKDLPSDMKFFATPSIRESPILIPSPSLKSSQLRKAVIQSFADENIPFFGALKKGYEASPIYPLVEGTKGAFSTERTVDIKGRPIISDIPGESERLARIRQQQQLAPLPFLVAGIGATARPTVIKPKAVSFKGDIIVKQTTGKGKIIRTETRLPRGQVQVLKRSGFGRTKETVYLVEGRGTETARQTTQVGSVSGQPIYRTKGAGAFNIKTLTGQKKGVIVSDFRGGEVAGVGQRRVTTTFVRGKQSPATDFIETFVVKTKGKGVIGGSISKRGTGLVAGRRTGKITGTVIRPTGRVFDPITGLEISDVRTGTPVYGGRLTRVFNPKSIRYVRAVGTKKSLAGQYESYRRVTLPRAKTVFKDQITLDIREPKGGFVEMHERGHRLAVMTERTNPLGFSETKFLRQPSIRREIFREVSKGGLGTRRSLESQLKTSGYQQSNFNEEIFADAFAKFSQDPTGFTSKYPVTGKQMARLSGFRQQLPVLTTEQQTTRFYLIKAQSQTQQSSVASITQRAAIERLKAERVPVDLANFDIRQGYVNPIAREQATGSATLVQEVKPVLVSPFNIERQIVEGVRLAATTQRPSTQLPLVTSVASPTLRSRVIQTAPKVIPPSASWQIPVRAKPTISGISMAFQQLASISSRRKRKTIPEEKSLIDVDSSTIVIPATAVTPISTVSQITDVVPATDTVTDVVSVPEAVTPPSPAGYAFGFAPSPIPLVPPRAGAVPWVRGGGVLQDVFNVLVREAKPKGRARVSEVKVNEDPLPYNKALNTADRYVDETSARAFRIVKVGSETVSDDALFFDEYKYRRRKGASKLKPKSFIEKSMYAIDSPGERAEITVKGLKKLENQRRGVMQGWF